MSAVAVLLVAAAVGVTLLVVSGNDSSSSSSSPSTSASADPTSSTSVTTDAPTSTQTTTTQTTTTQSIPETTTAQLLTSGTVAIAPGVTGADEVRLTLDRYFDAINRHDWAGAWNEFTASEQRKVSQAKLAGGSATTQNSDIVLQSLSPLGDGQLAVVTFQSTQDPEDGPDGQPCNRWRLGYTLERSSSGWKIDAASAQGGTGHTSC